MCAVRQKKNQSVIYKMALGQSGAPFSNARISSVDPYIYNAEATNAD